MNKIIEYKSGGIYKFTNKINGMSYIGQSLNPNGRIRGHIRDALKGSEKSLLYKAIRTYGIDNFEVDIIEMIETNKFDYQRIINEKEKYYINLYNSITPNGYNKNNGGSGATIVSDYTRNKLSTTMNKPEYKQRMSNKMKESIPKGKDSPYYGKQRSTYDKIRMIEGRYGITLTEEQYHERVRLISLYGTADHNKIRDKIKRKLYKERLKEQQLQEKENKILIKDYWYKQRFMKHFMSIIDKDIRKSFVRLIQSTAWRNQDSEGINYKKLKYIKDSNISIYESDWYFEFKESYINNFTI